MRDIPEHKYDWLGLGVYRAGLAIAVPFAGLGWLLAHNLLGIEDPFWLVLIVGLTTIGGSGLSVFFLYDWLEKRDASARRSKR